MVEVLANRKTFQANPSEIVEKSLPVKGRDRNEFPLPIPILH